VPDVKKIVVQPLKAYQSYDHRQEALRQLLMDLAEFIWGLPEDKAWLVEIKRLIKERTSPQNAALWGCAYRHITEETGNDPNDLHETFCGEFFGWKEVEIMGRSTLKPVRTTTVDESGKRDVISTEKLSDFYTFIQAKAAEYGVNVPDPDPNWKERMKNEAAKQNARVVGSGKG
jgi:hypothetical protein